MNPDEIQFRFDGAITFSAPQLPFQTFNSSRTAVSRSAEQPARLRHCHDNAGLPQHTCATTTRAPPRDAAIRDGTACRICARTRTRAYARGSCDGVARRRRRDGRVAATLVAGPSARRRPHLRRGLVRAVHAGHARAGRAEEAPGDPPSPSPGAAEHSGAASPTADADENAHLRALLSSAEDRAARHAASVQSLEKRLNASESALRNSRNSLRDARATAASVAREQVRLYARLRSVAEQADAGTERLRAALCRARRAVAQTPCSTTRDCRQR